ncbi:MAG: HAD-IB family phosphatase [Cyanobacteria bacterium MAG IRC1_bin_28]|nr:HAD-IB family phosphatase [Cyanobacteria bacterium MAG IRC1_bin_28]
MVLGKALVPATVFCDFDGTITAVDTFDLLMQDTYGDVWRQLKGDLLCFRLPLRQAMDRLGAMLTARHLRDMEERMATFVPRPGFLHFLDAMDHAGIPVVVVSGGFLPLVEAVLREHRHRFKAIIAGCPVPEDERGARHHIHSPCSSREELVAKALVMDMYSQGRTIAIGDGITDLRMAEAADLVFARDLLADLLAERGVAFHPWHDFDDVSRRLVQLELVPPSVLRSLSCA